METYDKPYSANWKHLDSILLYKTNDFQYHSDVIITEFDDCLIKHITSTKLYNTMNITTVEVYADDLIKQLKEDSSSHSIVVISNQINASKLNLDMIKRKVEGIVDDIHMPLLCIFPLKPNRYMKPHTGCWRFLNMYFKTYGGRNIRKAIVVSNEGGLIEEKTKRNGDYVSKVVASDVDRAFAWNVGIPYMAIDEYLGLIDNVKYIWDRRIIEPKNRMLYIEHTKKIESIDIFKELAKLGNLDYYIIMIMGAPRCGKTKLANEFIKKWRGSNFGKFNAIRRVSKDKMTKARRLREFKKCVDDRISVVIDGECHTRFLRKPYLDHMQKKDFIIPILCVEVNCGICMAKIFNHAYVEEAKVDNAYLYKIKEYDIYRSTIERPTNNKYIKFVQYIPDIEERPTITQFRY